MSQGVLDPAQLMEETSSPATTGALKANSVVQVHTRPQMILPDKTSWDLRKMDSVSDI